MQQVEEEHFNAILVNVVHVRHGGRMVRKLNSIDAAAVLLRICASMNVYLATKAVHLETSKFSVTKASTIESIAFRRDSSCVGLRLRQKASAPHRPAP